MSKYGGVVIKSEEPDQKLPQSEKTEDVMDHSDNVRRHAYRKGRFTEKVKNY